MERKTQCSNIAESLIEKIPIFIQEWETRVRARIINSQEEQSAILINHLPSLIKNMADSFLEINDSNFRIIKENKFFAQEHGRLRASHTNFSLTELIEEYSILRDIILKFIFNFFGQGVQCIDYINIIQSYIDEAILYSVNEFSKIKDKSLQKAYHEVEAAHQHLRDFFMQSPLAIAILQGENHRFELANDTFTKLVHREVLGKNLLDVFSQQGIQYFKQLLDETYKSGISHRENETLVQIFPHSKDSKAIWINFFLHPLRDGDEKIIGVMVIIIEVTELVKSRQRLEENEARLAAEKFKLNSIFEKSPAAMAFWRGKDLIFEKINSHYQALFGERSLLNKKMVDALPEFKGHGFEHLLRQVLETGEPFSAQEALMKVQRTKDGPLEEVYVDFTCVQIPDAEGKPYGVFGHTLDVTERVLANRLLKENKEKLQNYVNLLEREREVRERFVAALSHDLRTPMTAAKMSAQVLIRKPDDPEVVHKMSNRIAANMYRADNMIRDILDASRIKAGEKISLNMVECEMSQVVRATMENLATIHGDRFKLEASGPIKGHWDCQALERIIENLVNNAVKYGSGTTPITIAIKKTDQWAELSVHNWGNPLSLEEQQLIFKPYKRLTSSMQGQKGWGIGLTLVSGFAEAQGGCVKVSSSPTTGTSFSVFLPLN